MHHRERTRLSRFSEGSSFTTLDCCARQVGPNYKEPVSRIKYQLSDSAQTLKQVSGLPTLRGAPGRENVIATVADPENENESLELQFEKHLGVDDEDDAGLPDEEW